MMVTTGEYRALICCEFCDHRIATKNEIYANGDVNHCTFEKDGVFYMKFYDNDDNVSSIFADDYCDVPIPKKCPYRKDHILYRNSQAIKDKLDKI